MARREPKTLLEAIRYFSNADVCQDFMVALRWPDGVRCPTCDSENVGYVATRRVWECKTKHGKKQFSVKVGTIFEDSPISLDKWLASIWMIANAKNGVSSYEISRAIGVTQKSAWFMLHRIRLAMQSGDFEKMQGPVEADETFVGGKLKNMHKDKRDRVKGVAKRGSIIGKTAVFGLLERHGPKGHSRVRAQIVRNVGRRVLLPEIRKNVAKGSKVYTDAARSYRLVRQEYEHEYIDHAEAYVRDQVHTNGLENFWSLLKRAIHGTYVSVEPFHLIQYVDEQVFRYNSRKDNDAGRFRDVSKGIVGKRLTYKQLIGASTTPA
jgi:transposase-like protein